MGSGVPVAWALETMSICHHLPVTLLWPWGQARLVRCWLWCLERLRGHSRTCSPCQALCAIICPSAAWLEISISTQCCCLGNWHSVGARVQTVECARPGLLGALHPPSAQALLRVMAGLVWGPCMLGTVREAGRGTNTTVLSAQIPRMPCFPHLGLDNSELFHRASSAGAAGFGPELRLNPVSESWVWSLHLLLLLVPASWPKLCK